MRQQYGKRPGKAGSRPRWERANRSASGEHVTIYGIHPVQAALANAQRPVHSLLLTRNAEQRLAQELERRQITPERVLPRDIDRRLGPEAVHQGALLETDALPEPSLSELAELSSERPLVILDHVTDPHNVGAILRSAAVFGASGLIMTRRHSPPLDGTLAKSASGALEQVPVLLVQNLARAITTLKELGVTIVGLDSAAADQLEASPWPAQTALVLGAEGRGLRQLTRELCDRLVRITTGGSLASLNVSNAAAVALHWAAVHR
jgi:23S rRNA (guanosine2251-2'-O)-methyltransferase